LFRLHHVAYRYSELQTVRLLLFLQYMRSDSAVRTICRRNEFW
jgi:hypothetical protein